MTDQTTARRPTPTVETRPLWLDPCRGSVVGVAQVLSGPAPTRPVPREVLLDPRNAAPVMGVAQILSGPAPRRPDPRVRTR